MQSIKSNESFKAVINSETPVIVKFEAGWCPDCRAIELWIESFVEQYKDYQLYTVNRNELE
ncbi:thioredoxin family protein, partial [Staphylococcus aureus]